MNFGCLAELRLCKQWRPGHVQLTCLNQMLPVSCMYVLYDSYSDKHRSQGPLYCRLDCMFIPDANFSSGRAPGKQILYVPSLSHVHSISSEVDTSTPA